jgi:hypothetical protein
MWPRAAAAPPPRRAAARPRLRDGDGNALRWRPHAYGGVIIIMAAAGTPAGLG